MSLRATIWGARGSIPAPGPDTARYGGNTACVSVELPESASGRVIILDAGTGIRNLGRKLAEAEKPVDVDLVVSHTHWDHIQGLPFFAPLFADGSRVRIWGAKQGDVDLETILREQMNPVVFPVPLDGLAAELQVEHVGEGEFELDGCLVSVMRVRHPGHTLGLRLQPTEGGPSLAYVTDNEVGPGGNYEVGSDWRDRFIKFLDGVDTLIHDSMYTEEEVKKYSGWGHSSFVEAVDVAAEAGAKRLVLFHHNPDHDDEAVDKLLSEARAVAAERAGNLDVIAGCEGMELNI